MTEYVHCKQCGEPLGRGADWIIYKMDGFNNSWYECRTCHSRAEEALHADPAFIFPNCRCKHCVRKHELS